MMAMLSCSSGVMKVTSDDASSGLDTAENDDIEDADSDDSDIPDNTEDTSSTNNVSFFDEAGEASVTTLTDSFVSSGDVEFEYELYSPDAASVDGKVVLIHGFIRNMGHHVGWAQHLASWGIPTIIATVQHSSVWDSNQDLNAEEMVELVESLGGGPILYMGHSNGAMAALHASTLDSDAVAVLAMDPVEPEGTDHTEEAASISLPVYGIFGEEGSCNGDNNGLPVWQAAPNGHNIRLTEADHCDFENPTDWQYSTLCAGSNDQFSDEEIAVSLRNLVTGFVLWQLGDHAGGEGWWTGISYNELLSSGTISEL